MGLFSLLINFIYYFYSFKTVRICLAFNLIVNIGFILVETNHFRPKTQVNNQTVSVCGNSYYTAASINTGLHSKFPPLLIGCKAKKSKLLPSSPFTVLATHWTKVQTLNREILFTEISFILSIYNKRGPPLKQSQTHII